MPFRSLCIAACLVAAFAAPVLGAIVSIAPGPLGTFVLRGEDFGNVAALDLTVTYDVSVLGAVEVAQGAFLEGSLVAANPDQPGRVRLAVVRSSPLSGSGTLATLRGASLGGASDGILSLDARLIDPQGHPLAVQTRIVAPDPSAPSEPAGGSDAVPAAPQVELELPDPSDMEDEPGAAPLPVDALPEPPTAQPDDSPEAGETAPSESSPAAGVVRGVAGVGSITFPQPEPPFGEEADQRAEEYPVDPEPVVRRPRAAARGDGVAPVPSRAVMERFVEGQGVLERFRAYAGERTAEALTALFAGQAVHGITQDPAIALSDGTTPVRVAIAATGPRPNFVLSNARLIGGWLDGEGGWTVDVLPEAGSWEAGLLVLCGSDLLEVPLTVAPPRPGDSVGAADPARYLVLSAADPAAFDQNGDGAFDYLDDFIFFANHLAGR